MSSKAVAKSVANGFSRDEHIEVAKHIERLFTESKLLRSHKDYKENPNILQVHRFVKDIQVNGKEANALITLFEKMQGKNKIYTIELESLENLPPLSTQAKSAETAVKAQSAAATPTEAAPIAKTDGESIAQDSNALLESTMQKFNYDERKAKDLLEWHKDSSPLTKDENGLPKVFYHGTSADELFEVFSPKKDSTKWGFWFASGEDYADHYGKGKYGTRQEPLKFSTFLKVKNPFDMTDDKNLEVLKKIMGKKEYEAAAKEVDFDHDNGASKIYRILSYSPFDRYKDKARAFQNKLKKLGYDGIKEQDGVMIVFEPNQIKHIENRGVAGRYFYSSSPNIFHSNPHAGAGLLGGSVAGIEQDENGNITFNPEKFALGLLGGAVGSKAVAKGLEWRARKVAKSYPNIAKDNPTLMQKIAKRDLQTYAMRNTHNTLTRFLNNNKLLDVNPQLFAGEKALVNEAYAPHKARLKKAKELESKGADEIEIWEKTGWYKDKDKKWKFEISQRGGEFDYKLAKKLTDDMFNNPKNIRSGNLKEVLQDKELFQAYPELQDLRIEVYDLGINGKYNNKFVKTITLNNNLDPSKAIFTLYHEIQHAIQDIEGFAYGEKLVTFSEDNYRLRHGEVEARNVQNGLNNNYIGKIYSKQSLKDEIQDIKDTLLIAQQGDPETAQGLGEMLEKYEKNYKNLGEHDIYNTRKHPHKTMDTPLKDTIAQSTIHGEALSRELESSFLDSSGRIDYRALESFAIPLPKPTDIQTFSQNLLNSKNATPNKAKNRVAYKTPAGVVNIYIPYAYRHFGKQGNKKENRFNITGALIHILDNPAFITRDEAGTLYFYKPFKNANNIIDIVSISIAKNGKIEYRTTYEATKGRLKQMITRHDLIYMGHKEVAT